MSASCLDQDEGSSLGHTSSRCLQDVFKTFLRDLAKISSRGLQVDFKSSKDILQKCLEDIIFKISSKRHQDVLSRCLEDISSRLFQAISSRNYRNVFLGHAPKIYGQGTKFPRANTLNTSKLFKNSFFKTLYDVTLKLGIRKDVTAH